MNQRAVVAFPILSTHDRDWLSAFRGRHDPQASRIAGHFTLVFPTEVESAVLIEQATTAAASLGPFRVVLDEARVVADRLGGGYHVFLVPGQGHAELMKLHDMLYMGPLRAHLRTDIPYVPHLTVAAIGSVGECEAVARQAQTRLPVEGRVDALEVLELAAVVTSLRTLPFQERGR